MLHSWGAQTATTCRSLQKLIAIASSLHLPARSDDGEPGPHLAVEDVPRHSHGHSKSAYLGSRHYQEERLVPEDVERRAGEAPGLQCLREA